MWITILTERGTVVGNESYCYAFNTTILSVISSLLFMHLKVYALTTKLYLTVYFRQTQEVMGIGLYFLITDKYVEQVAELKMWSYLIIIC